MQILVPDLLMTVVPKDITSQYGHEHDSHYDGNQPQVASYIDTNEHDACDAAYGNHCPSNNNHQMFKKSL
jgi:hypothetical protein